MNAFLTIHLNLNLEFKEGAFDEVVKGVDAIEHMASPFHFNPKEPEGAHIFHYDP